MASSTVCQLTLDQLPNEILIKLMVLLDTPEDLWTITRISRVFRCLFHEYCFAICTEFLECHLHDPHMMFYFPLTFNGNHLVEMGRLQILLLTKTSYFSNSESRKTMRNVIGAMILPKYCKRLVELDTSAYRATRCGFSEPFGTSTGMFSSVPSILRVKACNKLSFVTEAQLGIYRYSFELDGKLIPETLDCETYQNSFLKLGRNILYSGIWFMPPGATCESLSASDTDDDSEEYESQQQQEEKVRGRHVRQAIRDYIEHLHNYQRHVSGPFFKNREFPFKYTDALRMTEIEEMAVAQVFYDIQLILYYGEFREETLILRVPNWGLSDDLRSDVSSVDTSFFRKLDATLRGQLEELLDQIIKRDDA